MVNIKFNSGYTWENLPEARVSRLLALDIVTDRLASLRSEWQDTAESENKTLGEMQASVELLLSDVCDLLELLPAERVEVFGLELEEVVA
jgi:hypothetical protein